MDLSAIGASIAVDTTATSSKKRRVELPLKKRYQNQEAASISSALAFRNRNDSPTDDRASSDDSALPKTPCSHQSTSSIDVEDCSTFALDFSMPDRYRAKFGGFGKPVSFKRANSNQDGIDHGFESASTSSVTSSHHEEPLDLTDKPNSESSDPDTPRSHRFELTASALAPFPFNLFTSGLLGFPSIPNATSISVRTSPGPNFFSPSISTTPMGPSSSSKRSRPSSTVQNKKHDNSKCNLDYSPTAESKMVGSSSNFFLDPDDDSSCGKLRRNYKNMTLERRMEANARERTRVHTIGAAFDRLRKLIPSSTADQKLSKLSILRIACRYIMMLASMNGLDYSLDQRGYTVEECVEMLSDTINVEAKFKRVP